MTDTTPYQALNVSNTAEAEFDVDEDANQPKGSGSPARNFERITIWIDVPSTPTTGTMLLMVLPKGGASYRQMGDPVDMVNGPRDFNIDAGGIQKFKTVPVGLDTTYSINAFGKDR